MKKNIIITVIILAVVLTTVYIENSVKVCDFVHSSNPEDTYKEIVSQYIDFDVSLLAEQVTTGGTEYKVLQSTNNRLLKQGDIVVKDWINPSFLSENNDFVMQSVAKYVIVSEKNKVYTSKSIEDNVTVCAIKAENTIMILPDNYIVNHTNSNEFKVKDLSLYGHIRFYLSVFIPVFRRSI